MQKWNRLAPLVVLLAALGIFAVTQWVPVLLLLPAGSAMMLADGNGYATHLDRGRRESEPPYE